MHAQRQTSEQLTRDPRASVAGEAEWLLSPAKKRASAGRSRQHASCDGSRVREASNNAEQQMRVDTSTEAQESAQHALSTRAFLIKNKLTRLSQTGLHLDALQDMDDAELDKLGLSVLEQIR